MNTGEIIKECRESLNWTRYKLSEESGICVQTIQTAEKNTDCRVSTLVELLKSMGYVILIKRKDLAGYEQMLTEKMEGEINGRRKETLCGKDQSEK